MKKISILCSCFLFFFSANAQSDSTYQILIAKAGLLHLQANYKSAVEYYEKAFDIQNPDALTAYKAAGIYSLDSNTDKAFHYLEMALNSGLTEADWLASDPYFDYLRKTVPDKWQSTKQKAFAKDQEYANTYNFLL